MQNLPIPTQQQTRAVTTIDQGSEQDYYSTERLRRMYND